MVSVLKQKIKKTEGSIDSMCTETESKLGSRIIDFLGLKRKEGRVDTTWGTKTPSGIAACIIRLIENDDLTGLTLLRYVAANLEHRRGDIFDDEGNVIDDDYLEALEPFRDACDDLQEAFASLLKLDGVLTNIEEQKDGE